MCRSPQQHEEVEGDLGAKETVERMKRLRNQFSVHAAGQIVVLQNRQKSTKKEKEESEKVLQK